MHTSASTGMGDTDVLHEQGRPSSDVVMVQDNGQMLCMILHVCFLGRAEQGTIQRLVGLFA